MVWTPALKLKIGGVVVLAIPLGFVSLFLFGEIFGGDWSGLSHALQLLPVVVLLFVGWRWPSVGGWLLVLLGIVFGVWYWFAVSFPLLTILLVELLLFAPLIVSGVLLIAAGRVGQRSPRPVNPAAFS